MSNTNVTGQSAPAQADTQAALPNPPLFYPDDELAVTRNREGKVTGSVPVLCTDITLRDLFAAFALNGLLAGDERWAAKPVDRAARSAYDLADAMLAERSK